MPALLAQFRRTNIWQLITLVHHCKPSMSIAEVVTGADETRPFLLDLRAADVLKTAECIIWCPDESTRGITQEVLRESENIRIELRDLAQILPTQEKKLPSNDFIIMSVVLPATEQFEQALQNARQLLTSDGRLCLTVPAHRSKDIETIGHEAGFTDWVEFHDFEDPSKQQLTLLVGSRNANSPNGIQHREDEIIILQSRAPSQVTAGVAAELRESLSSLGYMTTFRTWGSEVLSLESKICISLLEADGPILQDVTEAEFAQLKAVILQADKVLWVSGIGDPGCAMVTGLARTVRNEEPGLAFHTLNVDILSSSSVEKFTEHILRAFHSGSGDNEFMVENEIIHVSRVVEDDELNAALDYLDSRSNKTMGRMSLSEATQPLKLSIQNAGLMDSLCFEFDQISGTFLEEDEIEVKVKATSLK